MEYSPHDTVVTSDRCNSGHSEDYENILTFSYKSLKLIIQNFEKFTASYVGWFLINKKKTHTSIIRIWGKNISLPNEGMWITTLLEFFILLQFCSNIYGKKTKFFFIYLNLLSTENCSKSTMKVTFSQGAPRLAASPPLIIFQFEALVVWFSDIACGLTSGIKNWNFQG